MGLVPRLRASYRRLDDWIRARPRTHLALLIVVPGAAWAGASLALGDEDPVGAVVLGLTFGLVYGGLTWSVKRWRQSDGKPG